MYDRFKEKNGLPRSAERIENLISKQRLKELDYYNDLAEPSDRATKVDTQNAKFITFKNLYHALFEGKLCVM